MKRRVGRAALLLTAVAALALCLLGARARRGPAGKGARAFCGRGVAAGAGPRVHRFASVTEAKATVDRIVKVVGLTRNFVIEASDDVDNAESGLDGNNRRYIYFNPAFVERIKEKAGTDRAALALLAHEVGHHLLGHRTEDEGKTPQQEEEIRHRQELEADKFTGFVMRYLNASLREAQSHIEAYGEDDDSSTHPPMRPRLDAIREGWEEADGVIKGWVVAEAGQTPRQPPRRPGTVPEVRPTPAAPEAPRAQGAVPRIKAYNTSVRLSRERWRWTVFIDAPPEVLEQVSCVEYELHPTFRPPVVRVCERGEDWPFALTAEGWGTFEIRVHVLMKDRRRYDLTHSLRF